MIWPFAPEVKTHLTVLNVFTTEEARRVSADVDALRPQMVQHHRHGVRDDTVRRVNVPVIAETRWIFERLAGVVVEMNAKHFGFDLFGVDTVAYVEYGIGGGYEAHMDERAGTKISFSIQLSDPSEYEGGQLQILRGASYNLVDADRTQGSGMMFPAFMQHQVTPVTHGVRRGLLVWVVGPAFR